MQSKVPTRHHTPDDDPVPGTLGTGEDICPDCTGTGKQVDKVTGKQSDQPCERCDAILELTLFAALAMSAATASGFEI